VPITVGQPIQIDGIVYHVKKVLGKGGLSIVYLAYNAETQEKVAIKEFLYTQFYDPLTRENDCVVYWENEVLNTQAQAKSGKPCVNVIACEKKLDLQTPEFYIVLSFVEGLTFLDFYRNFILSSRGLENLDLASIVRNIFVPLAELLEYCHSQEHIIHRDFAVNNIIIQMDDEENYWPVLIDWGVSKYVGPEWIHYAPKPYISDDMPKDIPISQKGAPPEIRFGYMPTAASDIYYLGHLMYFVFTGGIMREDSELTNYDAFVLNPKLINWFLPDNYNEVVTALTQYEPADRPCDMKTAIKLLNGLIHIQEIHFDFSIFMPPDTDELTGQRMN
jgi:serine/threonine protein kinase